ncbi:hypothetical protein SBA5_1190014 [Candidatus Sulfotelmatomonas gaucii]|uniref:Uncharacterized protein n=1 Tax=Candidatus Sulfuritelmatomonas gaucii TaxID=2043161 RepID=A0A2N9L3X3_9BACT|nr:hypothetical protein SBA5_1190014 [Candidatus Sulfotelmatomonas gaucii]
MPGGSTPGGGTLGYAATACAPPFVCNIGVGAACPATSASLATPMGAPQLLQNLCSGRHADPHLGQNIEISPEGEELAGGCYAN